MSSKHSYKVQSTQLHCYTLHSTQYTVHTPQYTLHTVQSTQLHSYTATLHTVQSTQLHSYTATHSTQYTMSQERAELFMQGKTIRPGILVLINDADWELVGELEYVVEKGDNIMFISTLHGG